MLRKIIVVSVLCLLGAEPRDLHVEVRRELGAFTQEMVSQLMTGEDRHWGFDRLSEEFQRLQYEFTTTNDADTISYLAVRVANAAMMMRHYRNKQEGSVVQSDTLVRKR